MPTDDRVRVQHGLGGVRYVSPDQRLTGPRQASSFIGTWGEDLIRAVLVDLLPGPTERWPALAYWATPHAELNPDLWQPSQCRIIECKTALRGRGHYVGADQLAAYGWVQGRVDSALPVDGVCVVYAFLEYELGLPPGKYRRAGELLEALRQPGAARSLVILSLASVRPVLVAAASIRETQTKLSPLLGVWPQGHRPRHRKLVEHAEGLGLTAVSWAGNPVLGGEGLQVLHDLGPAGTPHTGALRIAPVPLFPGVDGIAGDMVWDDMDSPF